MNYTKHVDEFLLSLIDYERKSSAYYDFKLLKYKKFLRAIGSPNKRLPKPIIIAGTKGKGSTANFIAQALVSVGYKVGLYTSPHLLSYRERIKVNNRPISIRAFYRIVEQLKPQIIKYHLTFFEVLTTIAYLYFIENDVDFSILEVGLGGRLDATNTTRPIVSVITKIGYDHLEVLGKTLAEIALEKAGIIKKNSFVVSASQRPVVYKTLKSYLQSKNIPASKFYYVPDHLSAYKIKISATGTEFILFDNDDSSSFKLKINLLGKHQIENLLTAYGVLKYLKVNNFIPPREFLKAINFGFRSVKLKGRIEILTRNPPIIIDVAHNPDSIAALRAVLKKFFKRKAIIVFAASQGKLVRRMFIILKDTSKHLILTESPNPRTIPIIELKKIARKLKISCQAFEDYLEAFKYAVSVQKKDPLTPLVICGSFYLAEAAYRYLTKFIAAAGK
ncbi:MAG: folylpolyglutamate synthase/dihydrofolate synthase family protein [candidate division WOR-3 bacterium]